MQILKDDIRNKINVAALDLFKNHGYSGISMRKIAEASDMTVGNIYRYYKSKDDLFEQLLQPVIDKILLLLDLDIQDDFQVNQELLKEFVNKTLLLFLELHNSHSSELYILVHGLRGSTIEDTVSVVTNRLAQHFEGWILEFNKAKAENLDVTFISKLIASSVVTSCIEVLYKFDNDEERLKHMSHIQNIYSSFYIGEVK